MIRRLARQQADVVQMRVQAGDHDGHGDQGDEHRPAGLVSEPRQQAERQHQRPQQEGDQQRAVEDIGEFVRTQIGRHEEQRRADQRRAREHVERPFHADSAVAGPSFGGVGEPGDQIAAPDHQSGEGEHRHGVADADPRDLGAGAVHLVEVARRSHGGVAEVEAHGDRDEGQQPEYARRPADRRRQLPSQPILQRLQVGGGHGAAEMRGNRANAARRGCAPKQSNRSTYWSRTPCTGPL